MKRIKLRTIRIWKRALSSSTATSFTRALELINSRTSGESDSQYCPEEFTGPYTPYDEQTRTRLQLLKLEKQRAEAIDLARRRTYA